MGKFSTYGMTGIGVAAAIGFVLALAALNSNQPNPELAQLLVETQQPNAVSSFFFDQGQAADERALAGESALQPMQQTQSAGAADSSQKDMAVLQQDRQESMPILSSVIAINGTNGEVISEVAQDSRFALGKPVFIQAHFTNPIESDILDHTLIMTLSWSGTGDSGQPASENLVEAANFRGDIRANGNVNLEFYWNPDIEDKYVLHLFSLSPSELSERSAAVPILSIAIQGVHE
jgi:hypothetical protein